MNGYCLNSYETNTDYLYEKITDLQIQYDQLVNDICHINNLCQKYSKNIYISKKLSTNTTTFLYIKNLNSFFYDNYNQFFQLNSIKKEKIDDLKYISISINDIYNQLDYLEEEHMY